MRQILIRVWRPKEKEMSDGMPLPMLAGYITAIYPNLDNEVYMEYIGREDKNGKRIYEGDICRLVFEDRVFIGVMFFNRKVSQFGMEFETNLKLPTHMEVSQKPEVIGDIYQNPELIPKV